MLAAYTRQELVARAAALGRRPDGSRIRVDREDVVGGHRAGPERREDPSQDVSNALDPAVSRGGV
jgi:hypothetical protein